MQKVYQPSSSLSLYPWLFSHGTPRKSQRGDSVEIIGAHLIVRNPIARFDVSRVRRVNAAFAVAEFVAMIAGIDDIKFFQQFIPGYDRYSSDGETLDGAYGTRVIASNSANQVEAVIGKLKENPMSRRGVIAIYDRDDLTRDKGGLNTPCTLSLQFIQGSGNQLDMITYMRSSDIYLGLPNDVAAFTLLQEYIARRLGLNVGEYHHFAGSLHYYVKDNLQDKWERASQEGRWPYTMGYMPETLEMSKISHVYQNATNVTGQRTFNTISDPYSRDLAALALIFGHRRVSIPLAQEYYNTLNDKTLRRITFPWVQS